MKSKLMLTTFALTNLTLGLLSTQQVHAQELMTCPFSSQEVSSTPFSAKVSYTNGLPVKTGTSFVLQNEHETYQGHVYNGTAVLDGKASLKEDVSYDVSFNHLNVGTYTSGQSASYVVPFAEAQQPLTVNMKLSYTNALPLPKGKTVSLKNLATGEIITTKVMTEPGKISFNEADGLKKGVNYGLFINGINQGQTFRYDLGGEKELPLTLKFENAYKPLTVNMKLSYTNALPLPKGKTVSLKNLATGEIITTKVMTEAGKISFSEADGLKKGVNYGLFINGINQGQTFRYDLGGEKELPLTLKFENAYKPLTVNMKLSYTNALPLPKGKTVSLKNLATGEIITTKVMTEAGKISFSEADGLKKGVNYGLFINGINQGQTFRYDLGGEKELPLTLKFENAYKPLTVNMKLSYTNALPLPKGKTVSLKNLATGEIITTKVMTEAGKISFNEADGLKKGVNYGLFINGINQGQTFRYDLGGEKELPLTLKFENTYKALDLKINIKDKKGTLLPSKTKVTLKNLKTGESSSPKFSQEGYVTFSEENKEIAKNTNYGLFVNGQNQGLTFSFATGGNRVLNVVSNQDFSSKSSSPDNLFTRLIALMKHLYHF